VLEPLMWCRSTRGVTLIEVLVAIAITAILAGLAAPSFRESIARSRLEGAVSSFAIDLQYTRSEAVRAGRKGADTKTAAASLIFDTAGSYSIVTSASATPLKTVVLPDGVTFTGLSQIDFDGLRGTTGAHTIKVSSDATSAELNITTNALGRVAVCSPSGNVTGYTAC
jgi:prepilin-type N-terminal cleavage/methylation domain-containing protein